MQVLVGIGLRQPVAVAGGMDHIAIGGLHLDDDLGMVKLTPDAQQKFVRENPSSFTPENGAWGRQGCTRVQLTAVDEDTLGEAMTLAWQDAVKKRAAGRSKIERPASPRRPSRKR